ncbi:MAG TPA: LysR family transcriptional regulator [Polyangiaceae bacterium]|nr:LysR family transcriptional regulator [Polyangiaceae bacterium]
MQSTEPPTRAARPAAQPAGAAPPAAAGRDLSWDDLRVALTVRRAGTFAEAGARLGVAPSTVGRRVAALERTLGSTLFERQPGGPVVTAEGLAVLAFAERVEGLVAEARLSAGGADGRLAGAVRLTAPEPFLTYLAPSFAALRRRHPALALELVAETRVLDLARGEADLALRTVAPRAPALVGRKLGVLPMGLYASDAYLERAPPPRRLADLGGHALLGFTRGLDLPEARWFARHGLAAFALRSNSAAVLAASAAAGHGVALLAEAVAARHTGLRAVLPNEAYPSVGAWLVMHERRRRTARVRAVADFLAEEFARLRPLLAPRPRPLRDGREESWSNPPMPSTTGGILG